MAALRRGPHRRRAAPATASWPDGGGEPQLFEQIAPVAAGHALAAARRGDGEARACCCRRSGVGADRRPPDLDPAAGRRAPRCCPGRTATTASPPSPRRPPPACRWRPRPRTPTAWAAAARRRGEGAGRPAARGVGRLRGDRPALVGGPRPVRRRPRRRPLGRRGGGPAVGAPRVPRHGGRRLAAAGRGAAARHGRRIPTRARQPNHADGRALGARARGARPPRARPAQPRHRRAAVHQRATVARHLVQINAKLGVSTRTAAVRAGMDADYFPVTTVHSTE